MTTETLELSERFIKGLLDYNLTKDEIKDWRYVGGGHTTDDRKNDILNNKYRRYFPKAKQIPPLTDSCICGHPIQENAFISDGKHLLILGSCCVKRFLPKGLKQTCKKCGCFWKGQNILCKDCRKNK